MIDIDSGAVTMTNNNDPDLQETLGGAREVLTAYDALVDDLRGQLASAREVLAAYDILVDDLRAQVTLGGTTEQ